jgi:DHA2 family multidrug resistance protein
VDDSRYKWAALGVVMIGTFMAVLDTSIVNVALPHMMSSFGVNVDEIRWVVTLYMVTFAIVTLATNHLRQVLGLKRLYLGGLAVFTLGSLLCGVAWDLTSMNACRVLQALGGGVIFPAAMIVISECFAPRERGAAFGTFGVVIVFAPTLGPTLGGYLVDALSWRFIFTINLPVGSSRSSPQS